MTTRSIGRAWVRLCAASLIGLSAPVATAAMLGMAPHAVSQVPTETPQQRCQRETQQYDQAQTAAWQATHPGQPVPTPPPWPPYICVGGPHIDAGAPTGGTGGGATTDSRPDRWDGQSIAGNRQPGWSDTGVDVGAPRRGIARTPADPAAASALESARSNITQPVAQVTIDAGNDAPRQVIAAGDGPRRVVVDADGRTTGEVLVVDADGQARIIADGSVPAGIDADEAIADRPAGDHPAGGGAGILEQVGDDGVDVVAAEVTRHGYEAAAMAAGAAAAVAGALAAAAGSRPGRRVRTLPRVIPAAGAAGGGVPPTPWAGTSARFGWVQPDGDRQRFVVMADEDSARTHRFGMDVPDGGRMVANPDGSVDVVDADGRVVDHVKAPWAYDAAGRPVDTWYEVDNDTGELVQHVAPDESTVFPIIADPEQSRSTKDLSSEQKAKLSPEQRRSMALGQAASQPPVTKAKPTPTRASAEPKQGNKPKSAATRGATPNTAVKAAPAMTEQQRREANNRSTEYANGGNPPPKKTAAPAATSAPTTAKPADSSNKQVGTGKKPASANPSKNPSNMNTNSHTGQRSWTMADGSVVTEHPRKDGSGRSDWTQTSADGKKQTSIASLQWDEDGSPTNIKHIKGSTTSTTPQRGQANHWVNNTVTNQGSDPAALNDQEKIAYGQIRGKGPIRAGTGKPAVDNPPVSDRMEVRGNGQRVWHLEDGSVIVEHPRTDGSGSDWTQMNRDSTAQVAISSLQWDEDGNPTNVKYIKDSATEVRQYEDDYLDNHTPTNPNANNESDVRGPSFGGSDVAAGTSAIGTDTAFSAAENSAKGIQPIADDAARVARIGSRGFGAAGGILGAEIDRRDGMNAQEAYVTNGLGVAAAIGTGALIATAPISIPALATATIAAGVGFGVTKGSQAIWNALSK